MAWCRPGDKPLSEDSEPMMISLPTHLCLTRPQWVKWDTSYYYLFKKITFYQDVILLQISSKSRILNDMQDHKILHYVLFDYISNEYDNSWHKLMIRYET